MPGRLLARSASTLCRVQALQAARDAPRSLAAPTRMHPGKRALRARDRQNPRAGFDMMPREKKGPRKARNSASAGNRAWVTPMATMRSTIWPLMLSQSADRHVDRALWPAHASERQARSRNALRGRPTATAARSLCSMADAATRVGAIPFGAQCAAQPRGAGLLRHLPWARFMSAKVRRQRRRLA